MREEIAPFAEIFGRGKYEVLETRRIACSDTAGSRSVGWNSLSRR